MASKMRIFSLVFLAIALIFMVQSSEARFRGINPWCRSSSYKALCTHQVASATTWEQASINCLQSLLVTAQQLPSYANPIKDLIAGLPPKTQTDLLNTCTKSFKDNIGKINEALKDMETGNNSTATFKLDAADITDCSDALVQEGSDFPDKRFAGLYYRKSCNCLQVMNWN